MTTPNNPRIFLCHADEDKPRVEPLYHHLQAAGYFPWLDKFDLLPGQDWWTEIQKIIGDPYNLVVVCLSKNSTTKRGVVQQEITRALDVLDKMPEGAIYLIPARLEFCDIPTRLSERHCVDLFEDDGFDKLEHALQFELANREQEDQPALEPEQSQIEELEGKIKRRQTSLHMYEENLRLEDDADRRRKLQENIDEIKDVILAEQTELARIREKILPPKSPSPIPTTFIANAPYGLETALVGRSRERSLLKDWYVHDEGHPLLAMIALGGMGKSALTWDWLQDLIHQRQAPPLVVWWSFYETDGALDKLMTRAGLQQFGRGLSGRRG